MIFQSKFSSRVIACRVEFRSLVSRVFEDVLSHAEGVAWISVEPLTQNKEEHGSTCDLSFRR